MKVRLKILQLQNLKTLQLFKKIQKILLLIQSRNQGLLRYQGKAELFQRRFKKKNLLHHQHYKMNHKMHLLMMMKKQLLFLLLRQQIIHLPEEEEEIDFFNLLEEQQLIGEKLESLLWEIKDNVVLAGLFLLLQQLNHQDLFNFNQKMIFLNSN